MRRFFVLVAATAFLCAMAYAQDAPSLGDVARQARAQKQQKDAQAKAAAPKDAASKDAQSSAPAATTTTAPQPKTSHVLTNEDGPVSTASTATSKHTDSSEPEDQQPSANRDGQAEQWKSQILQQKNAIATLQSQITELTNSIHYAGGNCVANCVEWNERQQQKQQQAETMKAQLEEQQKRLEEMQETARKQGFGSSVYDPSE